MIEIRDDSRRSRRDRSRRRPRVGQPRRSQQAHAPAAHRCADFQALIPEFKAGRLPEARALLVKDHLHECVACRRVYEGRVVAMPAPRRRRAASTIPPAGPWPPPWSPPPDFPSGSPSISTATTPDAPSCRP